jgi:hypothetical protein
MAAVEPPAIAVAGHVVHDPAHAVVEYLRLHGGTVTHYDFRAAHFSEIDTDLIRATRSPWMGSRISAKEAAWMIDRGAGAPWAVIPADAQLRNADPLDADGLYDRAVVLWQHFWAARPGGVSTAKISKVLYLMRPGLFPILDSYLTRFYRTAALAAATDIGHKREILNQHKMLYWEAVRRDILNNDAGLYTLRRTLASSQSPLAEQASRCLSDLRLLDILAWAASPKHPTALK